jgi:hypothetical protein
MVRFKEDNDMAKPISKQAKRLTDREVQAAKGNGTSPLMLHDGNGLYLRIAPTGGKSWVYRYKAHGKQHDIGLGPARLFPLAEARDMAMGFERLRFKGGDPLAFRRAEKAAQSTKPVAVLTFKQVAEEWLAAKGVEWSAKHRTDILSSLTVHAYPTIGDKAITDIDTAAVLRTIKPKWLTLTETMSRGGRSCPASWSTCGPRRG